MIIQTWGEKNTYAKQYQGISFGKDAESVADKWGVTIPPRPEAVEAQERMDKFMELSRKYADNFDVTDMIRHEPADKWESTLLEWQKNALIGQRLGRDYQNVYRELRAAVSDRKNPDAYFDHAMKHIDVDKTVKDFTAAATTLGDGVYDVDKALGNPEALKAYRANGAKLAALTKLGAGMDFDGIDHRLRKGALFAKPETLPTLSHYYRGGRPVNVHTEQDQQAHTDVDNALNLGFENVDAFITLLALGEFPYMTFEVATTAEEWQRRVLAYGQVNTSQSVNPPKPERSRLVNMSVGPMGTRITPAE